MLAVQLLAASPAAAEIAPPWCGVPEADAAENLPDGTEPGDPVGSFPHIPYYAIECTLESIAAESDGRMTLEVVGHSATGREMYLVTINALDTRDQRKAFANWQSLRRDALERPTKARRFLERFGGAIKVPIFIQGGIHGNEYEGVDANMRTIERLATTPYGADPVVDEILDNAVVLFNVVQNPDGRVAGTRANANGFDLNRDYLTQSQSETVASVAVMQAWIPPEVLDLHGYATPTLIEATTKPHNPSIEYDLWLKWNQARIDANEAALNAAGYAVQRPINDWCSDAGLPPCPPGEEPGPAVAEGWDDWGPFYTAMYAQHVGLDSSTVEMCRSETSCGGRAGAREIQEITSWSTMEYVVENRTELLADQLEIYERGVENAPRPECCPPPFDVDNNWMLEYPTAYVIPLGEGQRSDPEANRLVRWLLFNGVEVETLTKDYSFGGQTFAKGSYVVPMTQARRGLADTALRIGVDVSPRIGILYAPPAAWSHGYLWGADVVDVPRGADFRPPAKEVEEPNELEGGLAAAAAADYALEVDSPTAVRALNALVGSGVPARLALEPFESSGGTLPAGTVVFPGTAAAALQESGEENGLTFHAVAGALPAHDPIEGVPRIAVLAGAVNQDIWSLRNLGFPANPVSTSSAGALNNAAGPNPLDGYDVVYNRSGWPSGPTARARLTAFFAGGGGYIGADGGGASFLNSSGQLPGLAATVVTDDFGESGIFNWENTGGAASPIVGTYPARDTAIMDPPAWFSAVPAGATVDGRLLGDTTSTFAAGLWRLPRDPAAASAPIVVHGTSAAPGSSARITAFAMNPLYRADPEREWPMVAEAAYWSDQ
ncbi:MAG TPA: M14 family zinc carboxypeptidase [Gaiellaceae bacterium]|nr:M14 family zinc carboxypeptidase [Gaiellaceae bacterium]